MWMCYVEEIEINDFKSGVRNLKQTFSNLEFDAEHESVYGMGRFFSEEECLQLAAQYAKGFEICEKFLDERLSETELVEEIIHVGLGSFLYRLQDFLTPELLNILNSKTNSSNSS